MVSFHDIEQSLLDAKSAKDSGDVEKAKQLYKESLVYCREFIKNNPYEDLTKIDKLIDAISTSIKQLNSPNPQQAKTKLHQITLDQIIGHEEAKREIKENLIDPVKSPEIHQKFKISISKGILMYGPPGTGKTTFAKAVATEINANFRHVQSSEILDKYVGESEKRIKDIFDEASKELTIILFDEFDQLTSTDQSTDVSKRIIALLKELIDGFSSNDNVFILAATNYPELIELGIRRRLTPIYLGLPDEDEVYQLLKLKLTGMPVSEEIDLKDLARGLAGYSGSDIANLVNRAARLAANREREQKLLQPGFSTEINEFDIREAINVIPRSISHRDLLKYEDFRKEFTE